MVCFSFLILFSCSFSFLEDIAMDDERRAAIEDFKRISSVSVEVKLPRAMDRFVRVFKSQRKPLYTKYHWLFEYIDKCLDPAWKMHDRGHYSEAIDVLREKGSHQLELSSLILSQYYLRGIGVEKDKTQFISLLKKIGTLTDDYVYLFKALVNRGFSDKVSLDLSVSVFKCVFFFS